MWGQRVSITLAFFKATSGTPVLPEPRSFSLVLDLANPHRSHHSLITDFNIRIDAQIVHPSRVRWCAALRPDEDVAIAVLNAHQWGLTDCTGLVISKAPPEPKGKDRKVIGGGTGGPLYADEIASSRRESAIRLALQEIADAQGDVDAFIA